MFTIKDVNIDTSKKLNVPIKIVEKIQDTFYKEVVKALNNYESDTVKLIYLGTFNARFLPLKKRIRTLIILLKDLKRENQTDITLSKIESFNKELSNLWKIKNTFSTKNYKIKLKNELLKLNKERN